MTVLDASAVLTLLKGEPGSDVVQGALVGASISAANWSEIAWKMPTPVEWSIAAAYLDSMGVVVEPVTREDAERAAREVDPAGLSLADRLCLALADRLDTVALTADRAWGSSRRVQQIR